MRRLGKVDEGAQYSLPGICLRQKSLLSKGKRALSETIMFSLFNLTKTEIIMQFSIVQVSYTGFT